MCPSPPLRRPLLLAATLVLAAQLGSSAARAAPVVADIEFTGVHNVAERELLSHMATRPPDRMRFWRPAPEFSEGALEDDLRRIERVYRSRGYYGATARYALTREEPGERVSIAIHVDEGEPVRLVDLRLELGPDAPTSGDALSRDLALRPGEVFEVSDYRAARATALERLADLAHPAARIEGGADVDVTTGEARVDWRIEPGPRVRFGAIRVSGLDRVDERVVRRELTVAEGEPFSAAALDRTRRRLIALQLFRYVAVQPKRGEAVVAPDGDVTWPVSIDVDERPPRSIGFGAGWASGLGPRGSVRWSHRNFLGDARRLDLSASGSPLEQAADARALQPYLLGTRAALEAHASWRRRSRDSYDASEVTLTVGPRRAFGEHWVGEAAYRFGWTGVRNVRDTTNEVLRAQRGVGLLSGLGLRARRVAVDHSADPKRGTWLELGLGTNLRAFGSNFDWMHYAAELRGYLPLGPVVLAARLRFVAVDPFGSTQPEEVPLGERLFLGGPHLGRGFPFEKLGPLDENGDPVGGVTSILASLEWRVPIYGPVGGVVFADAGQVSLDPFRFEADAIGVGVGAGLTFATPIGPVAGYVGYPVRELGVSRRARFAISVGHSF